MKHLYIHVPFCARRCSYCDFSISVRRDTPVEDYLRGVRRELDLRLKAPSLETVYLGGGTPSRLGGTGIWALLDLVRQHSSIEAGAEVTIEANPEDISKENVSAWREAGVNRLSLGAQSFDDRVLQWMHRVHDAARIAQAAEIAHGEGIANISVDLIFALPESLHRDWGDDLEKALALDPAHISLYGLTVEPMTPLGRWRDRGQVTESPEERYEEEFLEAHTRLEAAGFEHYEVSNFARPSARARHNSSYWKRVPYLGVGPSAHSFDGAMRRWNVAPYAEWLKRLGTSGDPLGGEESLDPEAVNAERIYLGLRTMDGLRATPEERERAHSWIAAGWAWLDGEALKLTPHGWLRLDSLAAGLTAGRSR